MEKHEAWTDLLHEHRDVAVAATTGHIPGIRHRVQHAWWYAGRNSVLGSKKSIRKAVKIGNNIIYWG